MTEDEYMIDWKERFDTLEKAYKHCAMAIVLSDASDPNYIRLDGELYRKAMDIIEETDTQLLGEERW